MHWKVKKVCGEYNVKIDDELLKKLALISNGDVRTALNGLEVAVLTTKMQADGYIHITEDDIKIVFKKEKRFLIKKEIHIMII